jgi:hypothetical protein
VTPTAAPMRFRIPYLTCGNCGTQVAVTDAAGRVTMPTFIGVTDDGKVPDRAATVLWLMCVFCVAKLPGHARAYVAPLWHSASFAPDGCSPALTEETTLRLLLHLGAVAEEGPPQTRRVLGPARIRLSWPRGRRSGTAAR